MSAHRAIETRIGAELAGFSSYLWRRRIVHRVFDTADGRQVLVVAREEDVAEVRSAFERWQRGELSLAAPVVTQAPLRRALVAAAEGLRRQPLTLLAIALSMAGTLLVFVDHELRMLRWLAFTAFQRGAGGGFVFESVAATYARGEYWRLLTPVFLHFGLLHLAFNMLWLWELGRRIERARGAATLLALLVLTGAGGNIVQYLHDGTVMFGGMSGVIYGLLGYAWAWTRRVAQPGFTLPPGVMAAMLVWLVVCMSGLVEAIGFGAIANGAHVGGLLIGVLLGLGAALLYSRPPATGADGS
ncbi:MAG: Rhomboid protease GlpG [Pseudomonadales bacterium]|nr:Rhomboid protease GlpG [Pseudomonadales bacterium]